MNRPSRLLLIGVVIVLVALPSLMTAVGQGKKKQRAGREAATARARKTVRMLDDLYKTAVVLITDKYVHDEDDFPAGSAAIALFDAMKEKGWHEVRLLDATGEPNDPGNVAKDAFEREAIKRLKAGAAYYDQIETRDGVSYLRAATSVPVVLDKCTLCHESYKEAKPGAAIGALSYTMRIE